MFSFSPLLTPFDFPGENTGNPSVLWYFYQKEGVQKGVLGKNRLIGILVNNYSGSPEEATGVLQKKSVLKNFTKFTGKHLCWILFFNKVAGLRPAAVVKKTLQHRCFPENFVKFSRTPFLQNASRRLLLKVWCVITIQLFLYNAFTRFKAVTGHREKWIF